MKQERADKTGSTEIRFQYLQAMGIQAWQLRDSGPSGSESDESSKGLEETVREIVDARGLSWQELESHVAHCELCGLHQTRTQPVFGTGNKNADWLIIGEAPGRDEDLQGEPFVGRAGQLLNAMLKAAGLSREQVYIANILKCRPPNNRDPHPDEVLCCEPWLMRQITLINPKLILAVGRIAAQNLLKTDQAIGKLRNRVHQLAGTEISVVATYHPAYLLRSPKEKRKAWQDLQLAMRVAKES